MSVPALCRTTPQVSVVSGFMLMGSINLPREWVRGEIAQRSKPVHLRDVPHYFIDKQKVSNQQFDLYCDINQNNPHALLAINSRNRVHFIARGPTEESLWDLSRNLPSHIFQQLHHGQHPFRAHSEVMFEVVRVVPRSRSSDLPKEVSGKNKPANGTLWEAMGYAQWVGGRLPTEEEWEKAARGRPVDLKEVMSQEGIRTNDFVDWARDRYENFFAYNQMNNFFTDPTDEIFQRLLRGGTQVFGYRVFSSPSGKFSHHDIWLSEGYTHKGKTGLGNVDWGPEVDGIQQMSSNGYEWTSTRYRPYQTEEAQREIKKTKEDDFVVRGGLWGMNHHSTRIAIRSGSQSSVSNPASFRCVRPLGL